MNRPTGFCPTCEYVVQFFNDGIGGPHEWRCGNCFCGYTSKQLDQLEETHRQLKQHAEERQKILDDALRG